MAACEEGPLPAPVVSFINVESPAAALLPGETVQLHAEVFDADGTQLDVPITYSVDEPSVGMISTSGLFRAVGEGSVRVTAVEDTGVKGFGEVAVTLVRGFTPTSAAPGGTVRFEAIGFGNNSRAIFGTALGITQGLADEGRSMDVWVPFGAANGPVKLIMADGAEVLTDQSFILTGGNDDALEPNDSQNGVEVGVPFRNPFLVSRIQSMDHYIFDVEEEGPLTIRVTDKEDFNVWTHRLQLQVNSLDGFGEIMGIFPVYGFQTDERKDGILSRASFPAGRYAARIFVAPGFDVVERRYEFRIDRETSFEIAPDAFEPNDFPLESPTVSLPFDGSMVIENPWAVDYVTFNIPERSRITIRVFHANARLGVFFFKDNRSVQWLLTNGIRPQVWTGLIDIPFSPFALNCTEEPGEYRVGILENGGRTSAYRLEITATPTTSGFFNCRQPGFSPDLPGSSSVKATGFSPP